MMIHPGCGKARMINIINIHFLWLVKYVTVILTVQNIQLYLSSSSTIWRNGGTTIFVSNPEQKS